MAHVNRTNPSVSGMAARLLIIGLAVASMATDSHALDSYDFIEIGTNDVLATLELSGLPASVNDIAAFSLTPEGEAVFDSAQGGLELLQADLFFGNGSVSDFGSIGLRSLAGEISWAQDTFVVSGPNTFFTYHFSLSFFPFSPPFTPSRLELTGDAFASASGRWAISSEVFESGDYDQDGDVDGADYLAWQSSFGSTTNLAADGNGNGTVDAADYTVWRDNYGTGTQQAASSSVPEPASSTLIVLAGIVSASLLRRKPKH